jgi:hypothetical protein
MQAMNCTNYGGNAKQAGIVAQITNHYSRITNHSSLPTQLTISTTAAGRSCKQYSTNSTRVETPSLSKMRKR